jgi:hypothetical protein
MVERLKVRWRLSRNCLACRNNAPHPLEVVWTLRMSERMRGRRHSPGVGALVREAMRKKWFGQKALARN